MTHKKQRVFSILTVLAVAVVLACGFAACNKTGAQENNYTVTIHTNNGQADIVWDAKSEMPVIVRDGYHVVGYYLDEGLTSSTSPSDLISRGLTENLHVYVKWEKDACEHVEAVDVAVAPTCTETGLSEGKHCSVCGEVLQEQTVLPALGHAPVHHEAKDSTCTEVGWKEYDTCSRCDYTTYSEIKKKEHTASDWITDEEPTCTLDGEKHIECTVCHAVLEEGTLLAAGHTESDWITDEKPTCTLDGEKHTECTVCHTVMQEETLPATGHRYSQEWSHDGTNHYHAATCEHVDEKSDLAAHCYDDGVETNDGTKYTCKVCGYFETRPSAYRVTAEEFVSAFDSAVKFKLEFTTVYAGKIVSTIGDNAVSIESVVEIEYYACEGGNYFVYRKDAAEGYWIKESSSEDEYNWAKSSHNGLPLLKNCFSKLSYDPATRSYKAEELIIGEGDDAMTFKNVSVRFDHGKLTSVTLIYAETAYDDSVIYCDYEYSEIGTASVELPTNVHEHTFSDEWSYTSGGHYHETTCGHSISNKKDYEKHNFVQGICSVCGFNALILSEDGKTVVGIVDQRLSSVTFPQGVTAIDEDAFYECIGLIEIEIPDGVTSIGNSAFSSCSKLTKVALPQSLTTIGNSAFNYCSNLTKIEIPGGVTSIGSNAFHDCTALEKVSFGEGVLKILDYAFDGCSALSDFALPSTLTYIGAYAFRDCVKITRVIVPDSVTEVAYGAFENCSSLTYIKMSGGVQKIKWNTFAGCTALKTAVISEGTTILESRAFEGCTELVSVVLPKSLTSISSGVLKDSDKLEAIYFCGTQSDWDAVKINAGSAEKFTATPIYFYSDTKPEEEGNYWHYAGDLPEKW